MITRRRIGALRCVLAATLALLPTRAAATWSIVAVDPDTREVGAAVASCIMDWQEVAGLVPGRGAIVAQAMGLPRGRLRGEELLARGHSPAEVIEVVANPEFDAPLGFPSYRLRQYGVAALGAAGSPLASAANYTGEWTFPWSGGATAQGVSVQGNLLADERVIEAALAAFTAPGAGCRRNLADRLMAALEAGAAAGGDRRCAPELAALSAAIQVAGPGDPRGSPALSLWATRPGEPPVSWLREIARLFLAPVAGTRAENPVLLLRAQLDRRREGKRRPGECS